MSSVVKLSAAMLKSSQAKQAMAEAWLKGELSNKLFIAKLLL